MPLRPWKHEGVKEAVSSDAIGVARLNRPVAKLAVHWVPILAVVPAEASPGHLDG